MKTNGPVLKLLYKGVMCEYNPKEDITAYELARLHLLITVAVYSSVNEQDRDAYIDKHHLARHFDNPLIQAADHMSDKGYQLSTHEKQSEFAKNRCWCHTCRPITPDDMRMVLCPDCGNKRCPKATDHNLSCTNSNEPNQPGSIY